MTTRFDHAADATVEPEQTQLEGFDEDIKKLQEWWASRSSQEAQHVIPKIKEYGSADLLVMGSTMETLIPKDKASKLSKEESAKLGLEMALSFYLLGKVSRLFGAYEVGKLGSDDTLLDIAIYTKMLQHVREFGTWQLNE